MSHLFKILAAEASAAYLHVDFHVVVVTAAGTVTEVIVPTRRTVATVHEMSVESALHGRVPSASG